MKRLLVLVALVTVLSAARLAAQGNMDQCGVCDEKEVLGMVWYPTHGWQMGWVLYHALGIERYIVCTFRGDGPHPDWEEGGCYDIHDECDPWGGGSLASLTNGTFHSWAALAITSPDRVRYNPRQNVLQATDCHGSVVSEVPMTEDKHVLALMVSSARD